MSYSRIVDKLYAGAGCIDPPQVDKIICLDPECRANNAGVIDESCYPIEPGTIQPFRQLIDAVIDLYTSLESCKKVYVHCKNGCDRTGIVVSAYLILSGFGASSALSKFYMARGCGPVGSYEQYMFLLGLERLVRKHGEKKAKEILESITDFEEFLAQAIDQPK